MSERWNYSLSMLVTYISVFVTWKFFPSRLMFLLGGAAAIAFLLVGFRQAWRSGYFVNRVDWAVHAWGIADLCFETAAFEVFRLFHPAAVVEQFHNNTNFIGCTLAFVVLVGGHRWYAMSGRRSRTADGAAYGQAGI